MDFYTVVIILAIIFLILMLTYIGIAMTKIKTTQIFPPSVNQCPDYWENDGSGRCVYPLKSGKNTGNFQGYTPAGQSGKTAYLTNPADTITSSLSSLVTPTSYVDIAGTQIKEKLDVSDSAWTTKYPDLSGICAKKKWAMSHGISWDGITNSVNC